MAENSQSFSFLIAAHCIYSTEHKNVTYAKLGMNRRSKSDDKVFVYGVSEIIGHSGYRQRTFNNDIALLKLNDTVNFTEFLYPACLPTSPPEAEKAIVTGYGRTGRFEENSEVLMKANVEKFNHSECQSILRRIKIHGDSMICYGNRTHPGDSCKASNRIKVYNLGGLKITF